MMSCYKYNEQLKSFLHNWQVNRECKTPQLYMKHRCQRNLIVKNFSSIGPAEAVKNQMSHFLWHSVLTAH